MKKYIAVFSVFLLPLFMSACGGSGGAASDPSVSAGCVKGAMLENKTISFLKDKASIKEKKA